MNNVFISLAKKNEVVENFAKSKREELEKEFDINIPDNEVDAAAGWTVSELCDYVEERTKELSQT